MMTTTTVQSFKVSFIYWIKNIIVTIKVKKQTAESMIKLWILAEMWDKHRVKRDD